MEDLIYVQRKQRYDGDDEDDDNISNFMRSNQFGDFYLNEIAIVSNRQQNEQQQRETPRKPKRPRDCYDVDVECDRTGHNNDNN